MYDLTLSSTSIVTVDISRLITVCCDINYPANERQQKVVSASALLNEDDPSQSITTDKPATLRFQIELEFGNVGF